MECLLYCSVAEALCVGVLFHEQDTWHSRERVESPAQGSNYECFNVHDVVLQLIHCKFFTLCASSFCSCITLNVLYVVFAFTAKFAETEIKID